MLWCVGTDELVRVCWMACDELVVFISLNSYGSINNTNLLWKAYRWKGLTFCLYFNISCWSGGELVLPGCSHLWSSWHCSLKWSLFELEMLRDYERKKHWCWDTGSWFAAFDGYHPVEIRSWWSSAAWVGFFNGNAKSTTCARVKTNAKRRWIGN